MTNPTCSNCGDSLLQLNAEGLCSDCVAAFQVTAPLKDHPHFNQVDVTMRAISYHLDQLRDYNYDALNEVSHSLKLRTLIEKIDEAWGEYCELTK